MASVPDQNQPFPLPPNEEERLRELYELDLLGAGRIEQVDRICALARDLFKVPVALVTLIDRERQCFLSSYGIEMDGTPRKDALCDVAILSDTPLVVRDAAADPRFSDNVYVCGPPNIRFYAGAPLNLRPGINLGTLCIVDLVPRHFSADDQDHLAALADMIVNEVRGRRAARDLAAGKRRLSQTAHMAKIGGYEFNVATGQLIWDDEIFRIYGIPPETPPSNDLIVERYNPETREQSRRRLDALFTHGAPYDVELRGTRPNGETFWVRAMAEAEMIDGQVHRIFGAVQDITERKVAEERIHELAYRDSLTGLPNRVSFIDKLDSIIHAARLNGSPVTLIKFDIDHFKDVNDALGQKTGDALLHSLGNAVWQAFSSLGTVGRIGSNEFAAILRGINGDEAEKLALDFIEQARRLRPDNFVLPLGLSAGLATFPEHGDNAEAIIKNAKVALLEAKARRRGNIVRFDPGMRETLDGKNALLRRVWAGIENKEFLLHYQPIVALRGGTVTGLEALMRWKDPELGLLAPGHFMAAFEEPELSVALGDMALDLAIAQMRQWLDAGVEFGSVAINLTTAQFHRADLAESILGKLARAGIPPHRLTLEGTENVYMAWGADVVAATIHKLHDAGVEIALDDFGTGYASLSHLRQFPIDKLKIDKSFVQSPASAAIVDAVINMGMSLGMRVVAEGVEMPEQLSLLRMKGCDYVQGYIFAKPLAPDLVADFIADFGAETATRKSSAG
jgi:diguanylate cyclase (GGDEF)-like protein